MSNEGQEWEPIEPSGIRAGKLLFIEVDSDFPYEPLEAQVALRDRILADHRDARQLSDRVRVLEEALKAIHEELNMIDSPVRKLSNIRKIVYASSPVATEGEGA